MPRFPAAMTATAALVLLATGVMFAQHEKPSATPHPPAATQTPAAPGATPAAKSSPPANANATGAARPPSVKTVVTRIQERIAAEVGPAAAGATGGSSRSAAAAPAAHGGPVSGTSRASSPKRNRITLEWRLALEWPAELRD